MGSKCFALPNNHQVKNKHAFSMEDGGLDKVIIQKSRKEVSPEKQETIECEYLAYFEPKKLKNIYYATFQCER